MAIRIVLWLLIGVEVISTILLVQFTPALAIAAVGSLLLLTLICVTFVSLRRYVPVAHNRVRLERENEERESELVTGSD